MCFYIYYLVSYLGFAAATATPCFAAPKECFFLTPQKAAEPAALIRAGSLALLPCASRASSAALCSARGGRHPHPPVSWCQLNHTLLDTAMHWGAAAPSPPAFLSRLCFALVLRACALRLCFALVLRVSCVLVGLRRGVVRQSPTVSVCFSAGFT